MGGIDIMVPARRSTAPAQPAATHGVWQGTIATAPDGDGLVEVKVPGFSDTLRETPCRYSPVYEDREPARGDICLVAFDDTGQHHVIAWWEA